MNTFQEITNVAARIYAMKDWHKLSVDEQNLVGLLELTGKLTVNKPANGFVGKAIDQAVTA